APRRPETAAAGSSPCWKSPTTSTMTSLAGRRAVEMGLGRQEVDASGYRLVLGFANGAAVTTMLRAPRGGPQVFEIPTVRPGV
ncbi:MAG TPA: hypothetical protein VKJ00_10880, partial [Thermoanaerobaculia bacterium]|nr:hypothetical protein [Thermoanaerobaculia bacterium]